MCDGKVVSLQLWDVCEHKNCFLRKVVKNKMSIFAEFEVFFLLGIPMNPKLVLFCFLKCLKMFFSCGTKIVLRDDAECIDMLKREGKTPITTEEGKKIAQDLKVAGYVECSAMTRKGLKEVFDLTTTNDD